jgi:hypothetical protein
MTARASMQSWIDYIQPGKGPPIINVLTLNVERWGAIWNTWKTEDMTQLRDTIRRLLSKCPPPTPAIQVNANSVPTDFLQYLFPPPLTQWNISLRPECFAQKCMHADLSSQTAYRYSFDLWYGQETDTSIQGLLDRVVSLPHLRPTHILSRSANISPETENPSPSHPLVVAVRGVPTLSSPQMIASSLPRCS